MSNPFEGIDAEPVIICNDQPVKGAQRRQCSVCGKHIYAQPENVAAVDTNGGRFLCNLCGAALIMADPDTMFGGVMHRGERQEMSKTARTDVLVEMALRKRGFR